MARFALIIAQSRKDPEILGLIPTGSRGKGWAQETSDYDAIMVVRDESVEAYRERYSEERWQVLDLRVMSFSEFEAYASWGSEYAWDRYTFANLEALADKTGDIQRLIDEKGRIPDEVRDQFVAEALDGYINCFYRSVKCIRNGNLLGARMEAADAIQSMLTVIFGREGRHRPFSGYLEREIRRYPLKDFPLDWREFLPLLDSILDDANLEAQRHLFTIVEALCRFDGHDAVFDAWGDDLEWMKTYQPE